MTGIKRGPEEATLRDLTEFGTFDTSRIWRRITEAYIVDKSDAPSEKLVDIFAAIQRRRSIQ